MTARAPAPIDLVVLISGDGSNLQAILERIADGALAARAAAVISDRADAFGLTRAARFGVPTEVIAPRDYADRDAFHAALLRAVEAHRPDLVALAGFMRILPARFVERLRVVNIHPSLLPKHKGLHTHQRALDAGDRRHGASVHWVTAELDAGAVIAQQSVEVAPDDDAESLRQRVLRAEHQLYPRALQTLIEQGAVDARAR